MNITLQDAKDLDRILKMLLENKGVYYEYKEIKDILFKDEDLGHVSWLIEKFNEHPEEIVKWTHVGTKSPNEVSAGDFTSKFIKEGGFEAIYNKAAEEFQQQDARQRKQDQILDLTIDDLVDKVISQTKMKKLKNVSVISAVVSAAAAVGSAIIMLLQWKCNS
jgi:hypothetical protein